MTLIARIAIVSALSLITTAALADAPGPDVESCMNHREGDACILDNGRAGRCQTFEYRRVTSGTMVREMRCTVPPAPTASPAPRTPRQ